MSKKKSEKAVLFYYEDITERLICSNCKKQVKVVIPASSVVYESSVVYMIHHDGEVCALDSDRGFGRG